MWSQVTTDLGTDPNSTDLKYSNVDLWLQKSITPAKLQHSQDRKRREASCGDSLSFVSRMYLHFISLCQFLFHYFIISGQDLHFLQLLIILAFHYVSESVDICHAPCFWGKLCLPLQNGLSECGWGFFEELFLPLDWERFWIFFVSC